MHSHKVLVQLDRHLRPAMRRARASRSRRSRARSAVVPGAHPRRPVRGEAHSARRAAFRSAPLATPRRTSINLNFISTRFARAREREQSAWTA